MAKTIKNKQYNEFWEDDKLGVQKIEKKLTKKVSGLEKEIKEIKEESKEESKEEIKPVNKPRGWHAKNEFIDDAGNKFSKGKFVGKVELPDEEKEFKDIKPIPPVDEKVVVEKMVKEPSLILL